MIIIYILIHNILVKLSLSFSPINPIYNFILPPPPFNTKSFLIAHVLGAENIVDISLIITSPIGILRLKVPGSWYKITYIGLSTSNLNGSNILFHSGVVPLTHGVDYSVPLNVIVTFVLDDLLLSINLIFSAFNTAIFNLPFYIIYDNDYGTFIIGSYNNYGSYIFYYYIYSVLNYA